MPVDVRRSPELQAALLAVRRAPRELTREINKDARKRINADWITALQGRAVTRADRRVIVQGARTSVGAQQITVRAATSTRPLSGGLIPAYQWQGHEYGMTPRAANVRNRRGTTFSRVVGRQFAARQKTGRVAGPAGAEVIGKAIGYWVVTIVDNFTVNTEFVEV